MSRPDRIEGRIAGLEAGVAKLSAQAADDATRWLYYAEIVAGQAAPKAFDNDPARRSPAAT